MVAYRYGSVLTNEGDLKARAVLQGEEAVVVLKEDRGHGGELAGQVLVLGLHWARGLLSQYIQHGTQFHGTTNQIKST